MKKTPILTADLMRQCDDYTIHTLGIPSRVLMERAARGVVAYISTHPELFPASGNVFVLCGGGNNGGDGFAVARFLHESGSYQVSVCYGGRLTEDGLPDKTKMSEECARQFEFLQSMPVSVFTPAQVLHDLPNVDLIIDALFGIGLDRSIVGTLAQLIATINKTDKPILAVDIPSGIHGDSGAIMGTAIRATATVTMQAWKAGLLLYPGADHAGRLHVCDIGVDLSPAASAPADLADEVLLRDVLWPRNRRSHKGTYGQLGLVCGSEGMAGAAVLAAQGALRSGAGLIRVVTPECNRPIIQISVPEAIVTCYDAKSLVMKPLIDALSVCDGLVVGCGLGTSTVAATLLGALLDACPIRKDFPVILDADALNIIARYPHLWHSRLLTEGAGQVIITPHPAEMSRLTGLTIQDIVSSPLTVATNFAHEHGVTVILKDAHTLIASPEGQVYLCPLGNAGMAKGGCGDVLAGILGALAVQSRGQLAERNAYGRVTAAAVVLHAMAGDLAADKLGEYGMTPTDLICELPAVTQSFSDTRTHITHG